MVDHLRRPWAPVVRSHRAVLYSGVLFNPSQGIVMTDNRDHRSIVRRSITPESVARPLVTPLYGSVVYRCTDADEIDAQYEGRLHGYTYSREGHPNAAVVAEKLAWMEGADWGTMTASGMAAVSAIFLGLLKAGDHIVAGNQLYGRSLRLLTRDLKRLGFDTTMVDASDAAAVEAAIRPQTRMIMVEVVSNPTLRIADMHAIAAIADRHDCLLVVDNTFTTPYGFQPYAHGADVVMHSATKLLSGHSDVLLGFVSARDPVLCEALDDAVVTWGLTASPYDCWLAERGLHTFGLRYERACANAKALCDHLRTLPGVKRVVYPGEADHPDAALAADVLQGKNGNMLSFEIHGGRAEANALLRGAGDIPFAPTLGDVATTLSHPVTSSHREVSAEVRASLGITEGFFRVSVGIEDIELLKREFTAGLSAAAG